MRLYKFLRTVLIFVDVVMRRKIESPIIVTRDGLALDGTTRLRLAKKLGIETIPYVRLDVNVEYGSPDDFTEAY